MIAFSLMIYSVYSSKYMEGSELPPISDVYEWTRQNRDTNVIRKYEGGHKSFAQAQKPTKKDTYLDQSIRYACSPGPASNQ